MQNSSMQSYRQSPLEGLKKLLLDVQPVRLPINQRHIKKFINRSKPQPLLREIKVPKTKTIHQLLVRKSGTDSQYMQCQRDLMAYLNANQLNLAIKGDYKHQNDQLVKQQAEAIDRLIHQKNVCLSVLQQKNIHVTRLSTQLQRQQKQIQELSKYKDSSKVSQINYALKKQIQLLEKKSAQKDKIINNMQKEINQQYQKLNINKKMNEQRNNNLQNSVLTNNFEQKYKQLLINCKSLEQSYNASKLKHQKIQQQNIQKTNSMVKLQSQISELQSINQKLNDKLNLQKGRLQQFQAYKRQYHSKQNKNIILDTIKRELSQAIFSIQSNQTTDLEQVSSCLQRLVRIIGDDRSKSIQRRKMN